MKARPARTRPRATMGATSALTQAGTRVDRGILPFPSRLTAKVPWAHITGLSAPNNTIAGCVSYRLNGPYDPDVAVGGSQPAGWDQYAALYKRYRVVRANVEIEFANPTATDYYGGYHLRTGSTSSASSTVVYDSLVTRPFADMRPVPLYGERQRNFKFSVVPSDIWGVPRSQLAIEAEWRALTASSVPTNETILDVCALNPNAATVSATVAIRIEYEVEFSDPHILTDA